jgi:hypothetical protein
MENSWLKKNSLQPQVFAKHEYIIGDSAYTPRSWVVSAYKKPIGCQMERDNEVFNSIIAKPRVSSEHTIGMLKCRFPFLRSIWLKLKAGKKHLKIIIGHIQVCIVLHNLLIGFDDVVTYNNDNDDLSDFDADNELNQPLRDVDPSDARRTQLKNYMLETYYV